MKRVDCIRFFVILISLQALLAGQGFAEHGDTDPTRWSVAIGVPIGLEIHDISANSETDSIGSPSRIFDELGLLRPLRNPSSGEARTAGMAFGGELEITSPRIFDTLGQPRIFARSALEMNLTADTTPTTEGGFGEIRLPLDASGNPPNTFTTNSVLGQGTRGTYKVDRLQIRAGAGIAFDFDFLDRPIRIKPSIEYLRREAIMRGGVNTVIRLPGTGSAPLTTLDDTRIETVQAFAKRIFHSIGPGLEIELETGHVGPFVVTLFTGFRAFRLLGTNEERVTGVTSAGERVTFDFELDEWLFRADTGLRFRWQP